MASNREYGNDPQLRYKSQVLAPLSGQPSGSCAIRNLGAKGFLPISKSLTSSPYLSTELHERNSYSHYGGQTNPSFLLLLLATLYN